MASFLSEYFDGGKNCLRDDCRYVPLQDASSKDNVKCLSCGKSWYAKILPNFEGKNKKEQTKWFYN